MSRQIVRGASLSEQLFDILREELESGEYKPGQKLMSESALAQKHGVSRLTVRAAIARLCALGYVETRTGEGSFVKERNNDQLLQTISSLVMEPRMLTDVTDFRKLIDTECVRLTILNAGDEDLDRLTRACEDYSDRMIGVTKLDENTQKIMVDLDFNFHLVICELSGNSLYPLIYKAAQEAIKQQICANWMTRSYYNRIDVSNLEDLERIRKGHVELLQAIRNRDQQKAKRITINHLDMSVMKIPELDK